MSERGTAVIALGNPLMGDDGFGLCVLERLLDGYDMASDVELLDGGTWGLALLPSVERRSRLLLIDAIEAGVAPGTPLRLTGEEIPAMLSIRISPHHIDMLDVLALARLRGTEPAELLALGVQPERVAMGTELTAVVANRVDDVADQVVRQLAAWGHPCPRRVPVHEPGACMN